MGVINENTAISWKVAVTLAGAVLLAGGGVARIESHGKSISALQVQYAAAEAKLQAAEREHARIERNMGEHVAASTERWKHVEESLQEIKEALGLRNRRHAARTTE